MSLELLKLSPKKLSERLDCEPMGGFIMCAYCKVADMLKTNVSWAVDSGRGYMHILNTRQVIRLVMKMDDIERSATAFHIVTGHSDSGLPVVKDKIVFGLKKSTIFPQCQGMLTLTSVDRKLTASIGYVLTEAKDLDYSNVAMMSRFRFSVEEGQGQFDPLNVAGFAFKKGCVYRGSSLVDLITQAFYDCLEGIYIAGAGIYSIISEQLPPESPAEPRVRMTFKLVTGETGSMPPVFSVVVTHNITRVGG